MNTFASTLFNILLGWIRNVISSIFNTINSGSVNQAFLWIAENWLSFVIIIVIAGVALDYIVWIIRWRPHYVWLSNLRIIRRRKKIKHYAAKDPLFQQGYDGGFGYSFFEDGQELQELPESNQTKDAYYAAYQEVQPYDMPYVNHGKGVPLIAQKEYMGEEGYYPLKDLNGNYVAAPFSGSGLPQPQRRRRSAQHTQRIFRTIGKVRERLMQDDTNNTMIDGLPPPISRKDAFYDPVYPSSEPNARPETPRVMPVLGQAKNETRRSNGIDNP